MHSNRKVKNYLINPKFQIKVISYFLVLAVAIIVNYFLTVRYFFSNFLKFGEQLGLKPNHPFFDFIIQQQSAFVGILIVTSIITFFVIVASGFIISHKVAGPIKKLENTLNKPLDDLNDIPNLKFRKDDFFLEIEDAFNKFIERLRSITKTK